MKENIRPGREVVTDVRVRLVLLTKRRSPALTAEHAELLSESFARICGKAGAELLESQVAAAGVARLLVRIPDGLKIPDLVGSLKTGSSRALSNRIGHDPEIFTDEPKASLWAASYAATTEEEIAEGFVDRRG